MHVTFLLLIIFFSTISVVKHEHNQTQQKILEHSSRQYQGYVTSGTER